MAGDVQVTERSDPNPGDERISAKLLRDLVTIVMGSAILISQIVIQFMHEEPNLALIGAGLGLLTAVPAFHRGDARSSNARSSNANR